MQKHRMWLLALVAGVTFSCMLSATAKTWRLRDGEEWESVAADPEAQYLHAVAEIKRLAQAGEAREVKEALAQLKEDFPDRVGPDLDLFIEGELRYWQNRYTKALVKYEKLLKDYPGSRFALPAMEREFDMGLDYLRGRKKTVLGLIRLAGYDEGVEIMERISDRAGLDEPNGVGLRAALAVAESYEAREKYLEAYLKWSEVASYWVAGPVGKRALYRMAENCLAAYNEHPPGKRPHFDASKLTTARTYYERFLTLHPDEASEKDIPEKIRQIDEQMAYKQYTIGTYYRRTGEPRAANLYFNMVVANWPQSEAAGMAREALAESLDEEQSHGE